jgi:hypothetical protein
MLKDKILAVNGRNRDSPVKYQIDKDAAVADENVKAFGDNLANAPSSEQFNFGRLWYSMLHGGSWKWRS